MKSVIVFGMLLMAGGVFGQVPEGQAWRYAEIKYIISGFTSKSKVDVDYGEKVTGWLRPVELLQDENGKPIKFKSTVDALNWMSVRGWELIQSYHSSDDAGLGVTIDYQHFIMRRLEKKE